MKPPGFVLAFGLSILAVLAFRANPPSTKELTFRKGSRVSPPVLSEVGVAFHSQPVRTVDTVDNAVVVRKSKEDAQGDEVSEEAVSLSSLWSSFLSSQDADLLDSIQDQLYSRYSRSLEREVALIASDRLFSPAQRLRALELLAAWESRRGPAVAAQVLLEVSDAGLWVAAMEALPDVPVDSATKDAVASRLLELARANSNEEVRFHAVGLLAGWHSQGGEELLRLAQDVTTPESVRAAALASFGLLSSPERAHVDLLSSLRDDLSAPEGLRETAELTLSVLGEENL